MLRFYNGGYETNPPKLIPAPYAISSKTVIEHVDDFYFVSNEDAPLWEKQILKLAKLSEKDKNNSEIFNSFIKTVAELKNQSEDFCKNLYSGYDKTERWFREIYMLEDVQSLKEKSLEFFKKYNLNCTLDNIGYGWIGSKRRDIIADVYYEHEKDKVFIGNITGRTARCFYEDCDTYYKSSESRFWDLDEDLSGFLEYYKNKENEIMQKENNKSVDVEQFEQTLKENIEIEYEQQSLFSDTDLNIEEKKDVLSVNIPETDKTRIFTVDNSALIASDRADFLSSLEHYKNGKKHSKDRYNIKQNLKDYDMRPVSFIYEGRGYLGSSVYESFVCKKNDNSGYKYMLVPHNEEFYKDYNKLIISEKTYPEYKDCQNALIEELLDTKDIHEYEIENKEHHLYNIPQKYYDKFLKYIAENESEICQKAENFISSNSSWTEYKDKPIEDKIRIFLLHDKENPVDFNTPEWVEKFEKLEIEFNDEITIKENKPETKNTQDIKKEIQLDKDSAILNQLGFIEIKDDIEIKNTIDTFKNLKLEMKTFYNDINYDNCKIFKSYGNKKDNENKTPVYIIYYDNTFAVMQDKSLNKPGRFVYHDEYFPFLTSLLLTLGKKTNLSPEETEKIAFSKYPAVNFQLTAEELLSLNILSDSDKDFYKTLISDNFFFRSLKKLINDNTKDYKHSENIESDTKKTFEERFKNGDFDNIFYQLGESNYRHLGRPLYDEIHFDEIKSLWIKLFSDGVPDSIKNLENQWYEKIEQGNLKAIENKDSYIKQASEASDEKLLKYYGSLNKYDHEEGIVHNDYLFMTQVINRMGKNSEFHSEPLHGFYFYHTPELAADRDLRLQVIEKELEKRGLMNYAYGRLSDELIELNEKIRAEEHIDIIFKTLKEAEAFSKLDLEKNKSVKNISKTVKPVTMKFNFEKNIAEDLSANNIEEKNTMNKNTYLFPEHFFKDVNEIKKYSSLKYLGTYNFGTDGICQVVFGNEKELEKLAEDYGYELHPDFFYEKADLDIEDAEIVADLEMVDFENKGFKYKDMFGITRQVLPPKEQLENNVCEIIYGLENAMQDNPDEFEPRTLEELRKEVCSEIFDMVSDGGGSVDYADNICAHLKFLGNKYIYSVIDRIGKECGIVKEETKDVEKDLEKKPYTFIVKDTGEFTEDFEPVTGLTAEEAVDTYIKLRDKGYYPGFTFHIPDDLVFGENSEHGAVIALNHNDKINFKIMGDTFINQLKNADERSRNYINVYKELYEAISKKGLPVELPQFVYDKEAELFNRWDYIVDNFPDYEHNSTITLSNDIAAYLDNGSVLSGEVDTIEKFNKAFSLNFENDQQLKEYGEQLDNAIFQCAKAFANNERSKEILFWQAEHLNFKDKVFTVEDIKRVLANIDSNMPYIKHHIAEKVKTLSEIKNIQDYVDKGFGVLADIDDIKRDFHTDNIEYGKWETPEDALLRRFMTSSFADNQMELYDISKVVINYMIDCSKEVLDARKATIDNISENLSLNSPEEQFKENKTPYIKLNWSESPAFREENKVYSVKEFNELLQKTDKDFYERKNYAVKKYGSLENYLKLEEEGKLPEEDKNIRFGYDKTDFKFFNIPDPGNPEDTFSYAPDRYDIGDGEGSVFDFVRSTCSHDDFIKALDNLEIELYYPEITTEQRKDIGNIIKQESLNLSNNLKEKLAALDKANKKHNELHKKWLIESTEADAVDKLVNDSLSAVKNTYETSVKNVFEQFLDEYPFASKPSVKDSKLLQFAANEVKKMIINELHLPYRSALKDSELYNSTDWEKIRKVYSLFPVNVNMTDYVENILQEKCNEKGWSVSKISENKEQLPEILFNKLSSRTDVWFKNQNKTIKDMLDYIIKIKGADFTVKEYADNSLYIQGYDNGLKPRGKMKLSEADITYLYKNKEAFSNKWIEKIENHIENQYQYYKKNFYDANNPEELLRDAKKFWNEGQRRAMEEIIKNQKEKIFINNTLEDAEKFWDFLHNKEKIIPTPKMLQVLIKGLYANDYELVIENNKIYIDDPQLNEHNEADLFTIVEHSDNQNALTDEEYDIYNTVRNTLINKNINKNNIEIKPVTLENILSIMEIVPEVEDDGSILLYDQQRKEYIDNDSGFENTEDADSSLKYKDAAEIFERLDSYIGDYIINDMVEQLDKAGAGLASSESLEDICRIYRNELEKGNKNLEIGELEIAESILNPSTVIMPEKYNQINNKNIEYANYPMLEWDKEVLSDFGFKPLDENNNKESVFVLENFGNNDAIIQISKTKSEKDNLYLYNYSVKTAKDFVVIAEKKDMKSVPDCLTDICKEIYSGCLSSETLKNKGFAFSFNNSVIKPENLAKHILYSEKKEFLNKENTSELDDFTKDMIAAIHTENQSYILGLSKSDLKFIEKVSPNKAEELYSISKTGFDYRKSIDSLFNDYSDTKGNKYKKESVKKDIISSLISYNDFVNRSGLYSNGYVISENIKNTIGYNTHYDSAKDIKISELKNIYKIINENIKIIEKQFFEDTKKLENYNVSSNKKINLSVEEWRACDKLADAAKMDWWYEEYGMDGDIPGPVTLEDLDSLSTGFDGEIRLDKNDEIVLRKLFNDNNIIFNEIHLLNAQESNDICISKYGFRFEVNKESNTVDVYNSKTDAWVAIIDKEGFNPASDVNENDSDYERYSVPENIVSSVKDLALQFYKESLKEGNIMKKEPVAETKTKSNDDVTLENFDHEKFFNIYHKAYDKYYNNFGDGYDEKLHTEENENCENFDFLMKNNNLFKETIISLVQNERKHDPFSSDRECAAVVKAFIEMGIDIDYSIENKTEQSKNVNTNNADIAIEADAKARKLGYNFRYNSDNPEFEICEIYRNSDGALLAEYGEGGFSYPDGIDEDMKISDDVLKDVISLAEIFYTSVKEYPLTSIAHNEQNLQKHDNTVEEPGNNILNETSENKSEKEKIKDSITVNDIASENLSSFINEYFKDVHNPSFKSLSVDEKIAVVKDMSINVDLQGEYYDDTDIHLGALPLSFIKNKIEYEGLNKDYPYFNLNNNGQKRHYDEVIKEYNDSLSEKINHISEKLDSVVNKTSYSSPFDIIENSEKGRVNIKFNPAKNNPYFEDIVKELKEHGWRYAPSSKAWYPVKIGDSRNFVKELYDKYEALILSESVIKNSNSENINPYAGIKFFDRNYNEAEDFAKYFSDNHTEISLEDAKTILAALNHKEDGIVENRSDRLGLDSENNLVIVSKNKNEINIEKTDLNSLLKIAKDMSHSTYHDCCVALEEHLKKDELSKDSQLQSIFKEMYENCRDDALEIKNNMDQVFEKYYKSKKINIENISSEKPVIWQRTSSNGMEYSLTPDFENWIACRPFDYSDRSGYLIMKKTEKGLGTKELLHTEGWNKEGACCHCIDLLIRDEQLCEKIGVSVDTNFFEKLHKLSVIDSKNGRDVLPDLLPNRMLEEFGYKYKPAKQAEHSQELPIKPLANNDSYGDDIIKNLYQMGNGVYQVSLARNFEDGVTSVGEFFLVNKSVASLLPENISNFLESSENDYCSISTSDPNVPYVLRQLIKQDIIPPKDTEFLLNLDEYIRIHPLYLAVENFFPVFPDNLEEKTKELVEINLRLGMSVDPKFIGKSMINMISVANNDILDSLLKTKGCTSPENTEKYFASLISPVIEKNQGIKNERKINKNDGYPPRGDN
ncbi:MAG: hypothetical protein IKN54_03225 [Lachnospiraceae bacterium]|nr:hypothetical protein [Lachnospiraceae bacterium]